MPVAGSVLEVGVELSASACAISNSARSNVLLAIFCAAQANFLSPSRMPRIRLEHVSATRTGGHNTQPESTWRPSLDVSARTERAAAASPLRGWNSAALR